MAITAKRPAAAKTSRHKKKYWRKGVNVDDIEDSIASISQQKAAGGLIADFSDEQLFSIDRSPAKTLKKVTKRQQAALDKITRSIDLDLDVSLPKPKAPSKKSVAKLPRGNAIKQRQEKILRGKTAPAKNASSVDLWQKDFTPKVNLDIPQAAEHFLRYTKKKMPNTPAKKLTSLLPAVNVPSGGASYNPEAGEYLDYVNKIAADEEKVVANEKKIQAGVRPKHEKMVTNGEVAMELTEGLPIDPRYKPAEEEEEEVVEKDSAESPEEKKELPKTLTKKQKARAAELAKEEKERLEKKAKMLDEQNIFKSKQINKELAAEEAERDKEAQERKTRKVMNKLTKRQRLGRGKFQEEEEPFLLQEELTGSLRQVKPQGSILEDRVKSMQLRNILPIAGDKNKRKLKKSLKAKVIEKRSVRDVKKGSRVI